MKKNYHLEGLRGIGALIIYLTHFQLVFFSHAYEMIFNALVRIMPVTFVHALVNLLDLYAIGLMLLHVFWAMSGYVIFIKFFSSASYTESLLAGIVKRYIRLVIPCTVSILFAFILFKAGLIYIRSIQPRIMGVEFYKFTPSFFNAVKVSLWNTLFNFDYTNTYNGPLWTIEKEMYGSLMGFALLGTLKKHRNRIFIYGLIMLVAMCSGQYWLTSFMVGITLCDIDYSPAESKPMSAELIRKINLLFTEKSTSIFSVAVLFFLVIRGYLYYNPDKIDCYNPVLAFFILTLTLKTNFLAGVFQHNSIRFLGRISFGFYVLHWPIICSLSSWLFLHYHLQTNPEKLLIFMITTVITIGLSWLFYKYIDLTSIRWSGWISKKTDENFPQIIATNL